MHMKKNVAFLLILLSVNLNLVACGPSQLAQEDQATQTAESLAATRTQVYLDFQASKPTSTHTVTITPTPMQTRTLTPLPPPAYEPIDIRVSEIDGMEMVYVPSGNFLMGYSDEDVESILMNCGADCEGFTFEAEQPQHEVYLDSFWIDVTEVTNAMYASFLNSEGNRCEGGRECIETYDSEMKISNGEWHPSSGYANHPVTGMTWQGAKTYCEWVGRRLPTEAEWEKAARGEDARRYPWGNEFNCNLLNTGNEGGDFRLLGCDDFDGTSPVGSFPDGASPYGALDMAGNVDEWVMDWYDKNYYSVSPAKNPLGPSFGEDRIVRGGSWYAFHFWEGTASRHPGWWDATAETGFRCVLSINPIVRGFELTSIHMVNENDGWALNKTAVLITHDGGHTWDEVTPPEGEFETKRRGAYGGFFDANHAWILFTYDQTLAGATCSSIYPDAGIWHTKDGGQTWEVSQSYSTELDYTCDVSFLMINPSTGWILINSNPAANYYNMYFGRTMDGGESWDFREPLGGFVPTTDWRRLDFIDDQNGWFLSGFSEIGSPGYLITTNGGIDWMSSELPAPSKDTNLFSRSDYCSPHELNLISKDVVRFIIKCVDIRRDTREVVNTDYYLYLTEDGGTTWNTGILPTTSADMNDRMPRLIFFDVNYGLLLDQMMWRTENGGRTWQHINTVTWVGQFSFIDRWRGWAIAHGEGGEIALVNTTDGGETWKILNLVEAE